MKGQGMDGMDKVREALDLVERHYGDDARIAPLLKFAREALSVHPAEPVALQLWCDTCEGNGKIYQEQQHGTPGSGGEFDCPDCDGKGYIATRRYALMSQPAPSEPTVTDEMVNRFLGWRLPDDFYPDGGVSFAREVNGGPRPRDWWPTGTNLLNADQARAMLKYVLAAAPQPPAKTPNEPAVIGWRDGVYRDSTPLLHVGDSAFEDWFQAQPFATQTGIKQMCRDSYAAGMGDPLVTYAAAPQPPAKGAES